MRMWNGPGQRKRPDTEIIKANVAQKVEQLICNQHVGGSIPLVGSRILKYPSVYRRGFLERCAER